MQPEADLTGDLGAVPFLPSFEGKFGVYFDGPMFWDSIGNRCLERLDILTFSIGDMPSNVPIDRLIIGQPAHKAGFKRKPIPRTRSGYKVYSDLHAKMVIGWMAAGSQPALVAVGSLNLCDSNSGELMLIVQSWQQEEHLCKYFNHLWNNPKVKLNK